ncbi:hypothetical protein FN846DRAFT_545419 [Sphaerosporella brunnea]|uniref:Uncharacterized protein n=1 Tax=Sphaerosporella brunnea TaxID=1250544 RepID=A0A5J5EDH9_9PEZI|nr:hypothetical protein FN846DRAFT_545419 [Sphaerosporella brunnea]
MKKHACAVKRVYASQTQHPLPPAHNATGERTQQPVPHVPVGRAGPRRRAPAARPHLVSNPPRLRRAGQRVDHRDRRLPRRAHNAREHCPRHRRRTPQVPQPPPAPGRAERRAETPQHPGDAGVEPHGQAGRRGGVRSRCRRTGAAAAARDVVARRQSRPVGPVAGFAQGEEGGDGRRGPTGCGATQIPLDHLHGRTWVV